MIEWIKSLFQGQGETAKAELHQEAHLGAAALLVQVALVDGVYAEAEQTAIQAILVRTFGLGEAAAWSLLDAAEAEAADATDNYRFTSKVMALSEAERIDFVSALFEVANADGEACAFEDAYARKIAGLLHVTDRDRAEARAAANARLGDKSEG
jgi:uncharacterized tellurite resistance protein B-like protein